jgi:EAL domain-containing protein (putative c-di-GMP-specific phosphodiesterase class I)
MSIEIDGSTDDSLPSGGAAAGLPIEPPIPVGEAARLADLYATGLIGAEREEAFDAIARTAAYVTGAPTALITLVDEQLQTCMAFVGAGSEDTERRDTFCAYAILTPDRVLEVPDTLLDERFRANPAVVGDPQFRSYFGVPIISAGGRALGTLCVLDVVPRALTPEQITTLRDLACQTSALIQLRTRLLALEHDSRREGEAHVAVLRAVGTIVDAATDLDDLLEQSLVAIVRELEVSAGGLWWHNGRELAVDPLWVDPTAEFGAVRRAREGHAYAPEVIVHTLETATRHGTDVLPTLVAAAMQERGINGSHVVPITVHGTIVGAFELIPGPAGEPSPRSLLAATQATAEVGRWIERDRSVQWLLDTTSRPTGDRPVIDASRIRRHATVKVRLARAVARGALDLAYEPIVRLPDARPVGVEALARWHDEELGVVAPGEFIPIAEETDLIGPLGTFVRRRALRDVPHLPVADRAVDDLSLWVNVSAGELIGGFADAIVSELRAVDIDPRRLTLEITERVALHPRDAAAAQLAELRTLGVGVALDDFGTGFTSLTQLHALPLTHVKVDRAFTTELVGDGAERVRPLVRGVIQLAHSLGLLVVAEGIETPAQLDIVRELGADLAQGHLLR